MVHIIKRKYQLKATFGEDVADIVGAMVSGNTETGITVTYQDADNTLDFVISDEYVQDLVGAMFTGNTEDYMTVDYQDSDGTIDVSLTPLVETFTPTPTASVGTFTTVTASGRSIKLGRLVWASVSITMTDAGTAAGILRCPINYTPDHSGSCVGNEGAVNVDAAMAFFNSGTARFDCLKYDGTTNIVTGGVVVMTGVFRAAA